MVARLTADPRSSTPSSTAACGRPSSCHRRLRTLRPRSQEHPMSLPTPPSDSAAGGRTRTLSLLKPTGHLTLGNLLGALRPMAAAQPETDGVYGIADLHALTVPHDPARLRAARPGDDDAAAGRRARRQHAVRAEPGAGAQRAGLPARVHGDHRRAQPDDPVQGEGPGPRRHPCLAAHLPGADGGRHPAVPARVGAGRRRPAAAPGADARPRHPLQPRPTARCSWCPRSRCRRWPRG